MDIKQSKGTPFSATTGTTNAATATVAGVSGSIHYITDVSGGNTTGTAILEVQQGTTLLWRGKIPSGGSYEHRFVAPLPGVAGGDVSVTVEGTGTKDANIAGYTI